MGQVPNILIVGRGNMARHWQTYLNLLGIPCQTWHRGSSDKLEFVAKDATQIFLAISDDCIVDFYSQNKFLADKLCIHFSGAIYHKEILGMHPLQTFSSAAYELMEYKQIPLVIDFNQDLFSDTFSYLENSIHTVKPENKAIYHALCVISGNFPQLLWSDCEQILQDLNLPKNILAAYLHKCVDNFCYNKNYLSGPIARQDNKTMSLNKKSLTAKNSRLKAAYEFFATNYQSKDAL